MKEKIDIPDTLNDMTLEQLPFYLELVKIAPEDGEVTDETFENLDPVQVSDLLSLFFNKPEGHFDRYVDRDNRRILNEIGISTMKMRKEPIREAIEVGGVRYVFQKDFAEQPVSFHRDIKNAEIEKSFKDIIAFCYVEEGLVYNEIDDKTKVIINERRKRQKALEPCFSLAQFIELQVFFLESLNVLRPYLKVKEGLKKRSVSTGKNQSTT